MSRLTSDGVRVERRRRTMKETLYPFPEDLSLEELKRDFLTFAFVRDPKERFASAYFEKMRRPDWGENKVEKSYKHGPACFA